MIDPANIDVDEQRDFETNKTIVIARFRAALAIELSREEVMDNPRAVIEAKRKVVEALAASPDTYSVGSGARTARIRSKDLP